MGERWRRFWFAPSSPTTLGVCRAVFFAGILILYAPRDFRELADFPPVFWTPVTLLKVLHLPLLPREILGLVAMVWKVALAAACLGLLTRWSTAVSLVLGVYLIGALASFGQITHTHMAVVFTLGILALSRSGDAWSLDRLIRVGRSGPGVPRVEPSGEYTWPIRMVWLVLALIFLGAGISKLRHSGLAWAFSDNLALILIVRNYDAGWTPPTPLGLYLAEQRWLCRALALGTLVIELGYPLALLSRAARWVAVPGMFLMLGGFRLLMGPVFYPLMVCHVFWIPWEQVGGWIRGRVGGLRYVVLFDGACGLCGRTVALIRALDLLGRVELLDAWGDWARIAGRFPRLDQQACLDDMHVVTPRGRVLKGFEGYRALAAALPLGWVALPLLFIPGVPFAGRRMYRAVASGRHAGGCPVPVAGVPPTDVSS